MSEVFSAWATASPNLSDRVLAKDRSVSLNSIQWGGGVHMRSERDSKNRGGVTEVPRGGVP